MPISRRLLRALPATTRQRLASALSEAPSVSTGDESGRRPARESGFPYISGDGLRLLSDVVVEGDGGSTSGRAAGALEAGVVFTEPDLVNSADERQRVEAALSRVASEGRRPALIIHNGDVQVDEGVLRSLSERCRRVFCVNSHDGVPGVTPIPIGLENAHYGRGGEARPYLALTQDAPRDILVLGCFNTNTNPTLRDPIRRELAASRHGFVLPALSSVQHLRLLSRSLLVISPPGNGPDCHRTWEAIAAGAIPVVLRGSLAVSLTRDAPIHVVDDVREVLEMNDAEIRELHADLSSRSRRAALLATWITRILAPLDASE